MSKHQNEVELKGGKKQGKNPKPDRNNTEQVDRRHFLKTTALAASGVAMEGRGARAKRASSTALADAEMSSERAVSYPHVFTGVNRKLISFPLGGVGAGSIGLGGRGQLLDWQIFNHPDKGMSPQYAFPSIWAQAGGRKPVTRVLEARILYPYEGPSGLGFANLPGMPRLASSTFTGEFPFARVDFHDSTLPVQVSLEAFTPFIPLEADDSGLPIAVLRYRVSNPEAGKAKVSIAFSVDNPVGKQGRTNDYRETGELKGLLMRNPFLSASDPMSGSFVLAVLGSGGARLSYLRGWESANWWESPLLFWDDFSDDGELGPEARVRSTTGSVCVQSEIPGHAEHEYTFLLAWHFPNRTPDPGWTAPKGRERDLIGNHYCTRFKDAWNAAEYAAERLPELEKRSRQFVRAVRETTLPHAVREAAMSNLATFVSPTCFRTADGHFHGFEGCSEHTGCCFGSCTHVWNYEAATASLFPSLSRSFRDQQFGFSTDENGRMDFRELLPSNIERWGNAAADGQMGSIMKLYHDWRLSGDTEWLRQHWPNAKKAIEFAWVPGGWDANRDGVMEGVQHNTYDVEFVGPNPLCGVWYLGALRAAEEMAKAVGDNASAREYADLFHRGSSWIDANLFNGEFYVQKIGSVPTSEVAKGLHVSKLDTANPEFQLGEGCLVDQLVGQYFAQVAGLGMLLDRKHVLKTLESIYKYNYKRTMYEHESVARTFALNDDAALIICDYSHGKRPRTPFPYFQEVMTGFEYSAAILMLYMGMVSQGVELIENIRRRYDGERRNPWDEAECGFHYARAMASWAAMLALSGFRYHGANKAVELRPQVAGTWFSSFWSTGAGWGTFTRAVQRGATQVTLSVAAGRLPCESLSVEAKVSPAAGGSSATLAGRSLTHRWRWDGGDKVVQLPAETVVGEGEQLIVVV